MLWFEWQTLKLMAEAFEGKKCHICGKQATRFRRGKLYCTDHTPHLTKPVEIKQVRFPRL
jgi:hypothetical protein